MTSPTSSVPGGAWPVLLSPFQDDRSIDWPGLAQLVDYYVAARVGGIFSVCLSSEMYQMSAVERLELARFVVTRAAGRVPVIASVVAGAEPAEQIKVAHEMAATGVAAVVLLPCLIAAENESDAVWQKRVEEIVRETGNIPLGFYECPRPYKRAVSVESLRWAAQTGRFVFHKDTCHNLELMRAKIDASRGTPLKFFNTQMSTLLATLDAGGHGFSSYSANLYPELVQWICENHRSDSAAALNLQRLVAIAEYAIGNKYPASAKVFVRDNAGVAISGLCRSINDVVSHHEWLALHDLVTYVKSLSLPVPLTAAPPAA